jgi:hypothetical protein
MVTEQRYFHNSFSGTDADRSFLRSWQDGTALCELIEVLKPGTIPNAKQLSSVGV